MYIYILHSRNMCVVFALCACLIIYSKVMLKHSLLASYGSVYTIYIYLCECVNATSGF